MVDRSLKYVASKSILCFTSINTNAKNLNQNFKLHASKFCEIFFIVEKCVSWT